jgi:hypothetical protein
VDLITLQDVTARCSEAEKEASRASLQSHWRLLLPTFSERLSSLRNLLSSANRDDFMLKLLMDSMSEDQHFERQFIAEVRVSCPSLAVCVCVRVRVCVCVCLCGYAVVVVAINL